ncbi:XRE family transcriptional regulator [Weissella viridescens]|uniref:XRE family transcriptional regulator n=1 Tax=Weissella viridescens TaxID=1629 RepID=A0A3P2RCT3_WEIVI|nr:helix-turn-helix transcriptional regulator [Weissella viridescens]RRG18433.1 XRE family transcriptional regulator [Weissella viridescens]
MNFGELIRKIRLDRNIKQIDLVTDNISRSTISRIENGTQQSSFDNASMLIANLGISLSDFERLYHPETSLYKLELLFSTWSDTTASFTSIQEIKQLALKVYEKTKNPTAQAMFVLFDTYENYYHSDFDELKERVRPIWDYFEKIDTWTELDLYIVNGILYYFDIDTVDNIVVRALNMIDENYPELQRLKNSFLINYSYLLMLNKKADVARHYLNLAIEQSKNTSRYDLLLLCRIRLAVIDGDTKQVHVNLNLLKSIGADEMAKGAMDEIEEFKVAVE